MSVRCCWSSLPTELVVRMAMPLEPDDWAALSRVDRQTRAILKGCPASPWMQRDLAQAIGGKRSTVLIDALKRHQPALRARVKPVVLPQYSSQEDLDEVAALVRGSAQRPTLRYTKFDATYDVKQVPAEIDATFDLQLQRYLPAQMLHLPLGLRDVNLSYNYFPRTLHLLKLPADVPRVRLHGTYMGVSIGALVLNDGARFVGLSGNVLGAHIGTLNLNDGVEEVELMSNNLGANVAALRLPPSVRRVDLRANDIDAETAAALRERYPRVAFEF